jgi:hypothetical protein
VVSRGKQNFYLDLIFSLRPTNKFSRNTLSIPVKSEGKNITNLSSNKSEAIAELDRLIIELKKTIIISPQPIDWPHIHERAKLARVPVIMYHDILPEKEVFLPLAFCLPSPNVKLILHRYLAVKFWLLIHCSLVY